MKEYFPKEKPLVSLVGMGGGAGGYTLKKAGGKEYGITFVNSSNASTAPIDNRSFINWGRVFVNGEYAYMVGAVRSSVQSPWTQSFEYTGFNVIKFLLEDSSVVWEKRIERDVTSSQGQRYLSGYGCHAIHFDSSGNIYLSEIILESRNNATGYYSPFVTFYDTVKLSATNGSVMKFAHTESVGRPLTSGNSAHNGEFANYMGFAQPQNPSDGPLTMFASRQVTGGSVDTGWGYHYWDQNLDSSTDVTVHVGYLSNSGSNNWTWGDQATTAAINLNPNTSDIVMLGVTNACAYHRPSWHVRRSNRSTHAIVWEHVGDENWGGYSTGATGVADLLKATDGVIAPNDSVFVCGHWQQSQDWTSGVTTDRERLLLVKYDSSGNRSWYKCIDSEWSNSDGNLNDVGGGQFRAAAVVADSTHVYMVTGPIQNITGQSIRGCALFCYTHAGVLEWQRNIDINILRNTYSHVYFGQQANIQFDPDGDLIVSHSDGKSWFSYPKDGSLLSSSGDIQATVSNHDDTVPHPFHANPTYSSNNQNIAAVTPHLHASSTLQATTNTVPSHYLSQSSNGWNSTHFTKVKF